MVDVKRRHLQEVAAKKLEEKILKKETEQIKEKYEKLKSDWREDLKESDWTPTTGSIANSTSQTFTYSTPNLQTGEPNTFTASGLGGVESQPSSVKVDLGFGETENVSPPTFSQLALAGYTKPIVIKRKELEDINARLDASEEFAKQVNADVLMKARVAEVSPETKIYKASDFTPGEGLAQTYPPEELEKFSALNPQKFSEYKHIYDIQNEITNKFEKAQEKADQEYDAEWLPELQRLLPNNKYSNLYGKYKGSAFNEVNVELNRLNYEEYKAKARVKTKDGVKLVDTVKSIAISKTAGELADVIPILDELQYKLQEIWSKKTSDADKVAMRETKGLQKASPKLFLPFGEMKPLELYMEPFGSEVNNYGEIPKYEEAVDIVNNIEDAKGLESILRGVSNFVKVGTAKEIYDYHLRFLNNPTTRVQDVTNLVKKRDLEKLIKLINSFDKKKLKFSPENIYGNLQLIIDKTPGLANSIGNLNQAKLYVKGNNYYIEKPYDFDNLLDTIGKKGLLAPMYSAFQTVRGKKKLKDLIFGTKTMNIRIKIPMNKT
tara:strand:+ start:118 stop:1764 length:1647 start_codon:yes stop_codon:yes gene_type:complete